LDKNISYINIRMIPNLLDIKLLDNDIKQYVFDKNSWVLNVSLLLIFIFILVYVLYSCKRSISKKTEKEIIINKLYKILHESNKYDINNVSLDDSTEDDEIDSYYY